MSFHVIEYSFRFKYCLTLVLGTHTLNALILIFFETTQNIWLFIMTPVTNYIELGRLAVREANIMQLILQTMHFYLKATCLYNVHGKLWENLNSFFLNRRKMISNAKKCEIQNLWGRILEVGIKVFFNGLNFAHVYFSPSRYFFSPFLTI